MDRRRAACPRGSRRRCAATSRRRPRATETLDFARSDRDLHEAIVAAGGNSIATALFAQTGPRLLRYWHGPAQQPDVRGRLAAEHGELVDLVLAGDAAASPRTSTSTSPAPARERPPGS